MQIVREGRSGVLLLALKEFGQVGKRSMVARWRGVVTSISAAIGFGGFKPFVLLIVAI